MAESARPTIPDTTMTLAAGTRLGPYEVVAAIGAGGMGEVYRARDTRLGRDIALVRQDKVVFIFNFFDELRRIAPATTR